MQSEPRHRFDPHSLQELRSEIERPGLAIPIAANPKPLLTPLKIGGKRGGTVKRTAKGLSIELASGDFADWVETQVHDMIEDLHDRWKQRSED